MPEPYSMAAMPETYCCVRYCHTALNKSQPTMSMNKNQIKIRTPINCARWSPEGRWLVTGSQSGEFTLWNSYDFTYNRAIQGHDYPIRVMVWSRAGDWMVSGDDEGHVKVWNPSVRMMTELEGHQEPIRGICFSPTDTKVGTCSDDKSVRIWDFSTRRQELNMQEHGSDVKALDWHLTKGMLVSGSRDNTCKLWSPREGRCIRTITGFTQPVNVVSFHPTCEDVFLSASRDCTVRIHDLRMIREGLQDTCISQWKAHDVEIRTAAWHPIAPDLIATGGLDGSLAFWIASGGLSEASRQAYIPKAHEAAIWDLDWNPLGHMLASGSNDRTAKFWARARPGDSETELYRGYDRNRSEVDYLLSAGVGVPIANAAKEKERLSHTIGEVRKQLEEVDIPGVGKIGQEGAWNQVGIVLAPPQDTAVSMALATEATASEQRRTGIYTDGGGREGDDEERGNVPQKKQQNRQPREVLAMEDFPKPRYRGVVKKWDAAGFGFISPFDPTVKQLYAHASHIVPKMGSNAGEGPDILAEGAIVEFSLVDEENRKTKQMQTRAAHIIDKKFFQPGFEGVDEPQPGGGGNQARPQAHDYGRPQQQQPGGYGHAPPPATAGGAPPPAPPPGQQLNPEFVAQVRMLYEQGQVEYLKSQLGPMGLSLEGIFPYLYPGHTFQGR